MISFGAGEPDFDTPARIKEAAIRQCVAGRPSTPKSAASRSSRRRGTKFRRDNGLAYEPADVLVSVGAKHTLFNAAVALLDPGDEVLVPRPYWVSYPEQLALVGAVTGGGYDSKARGSTSIPIACARLSRRAPRL